MYQKACHYYTSGLGAKVKSGQKTMFLPAFEWPLFEILIVAAGATATKTASAKTAEATAVASSESSPVS